MAFWPWGYVVSVAALFVGATVGLVAGALASAASSAAREEECRAQPPDILDLPR
jgi:hypothetical protein